MGGRGIGSNMESVLMNPLSRCLCELPAGFRGELMIKGIAESGEGWEIEI
jgi:hypothetical protein